MKRKQKPIEPVFGDVIVELHYTREDATHKPHWAYEVRAFVARYVMGYGSSQLFETIATFHASTEDESDLALADATACARLLAKSLNTVSSAASTSTTITTIVYENRRPRNV